MNSIVLVKIALITMVVLAILVLQVRSLRQSVILLSVFSLASSFVYVFLGAPDVAIAEAAIGVSLSTVLYLVAIKKFRVFRAYFRTKIIEPDKLPDAHKDRDRLEGYINDYLMESEIEMDIINTKEKMRTIKEKYDYDMIIVQEDEVIHIYGERSNYLYAGLIRYLKNTDIKNIDYEYFYEGDAI